ncbi:hypothetical protein DNU06_17350 [Putridiphycobacter roseus]|uniref:Uncharacterized protein n=1 Tax=Putridiphycobacter roseus TaxID=2219161 RepID=A0A2W1NLJ3_9FLAO|nr:hypothetical protein [Putridiphycobacter roseus]PZE15578.1 hypothetical protein DNU06_17350 [Putridiphycobacter roseus]
MKGEEIIGSCIGKPLYGGKIQSFVLNGELIDKINVTFLKFDKWIRIVSTDEITTVEHEDNSFDKINSYGDDEFFYPIEKIEIDFSDFKKYKGKELLKWKELVWKNDNKMSFGINLYFENDLNLIIHNETIPDNNNKYIFENNLPKDLIEK